MQDEWWTLWELWGGPRGDMLNAVARMTPPGLTQERRLLTFGAAGLWPHVVALWRADGAQQVEQALSAGTNDRIDESRFTWGRSKVMRRVAGALVPGRAGYLLETVRASEPIDRIAGNGPDIAFAEIFAPHQGVLLWGANSLADLVEREQAGWGTRHDAILERTASLVLTPPPPGTQLMGWAADPPLPQRGPGGERGR